MKMYLAFQLALTGALLVPAQLATAGKTAEVQFEPQIVRLSLADGDVRVARDEQQGQARNADWEKAVSGLPLETGFSLATGDGRAVIELQDASTVYLGPNSVLVMNDLSTVGAKPHTEMALLTGTVTLHVHPAYDFILRTPTDTLVVKNPDRNDFRVTAYMDAIALTSLRSGSVVRSASDDTTSVGQTLYYRAGKQVSPEDKGDAAAMATWDKWVAERYAQRIAAYSSVVKAGGLKTLAPGLDALQGQGRFVDCGEYGKCWEPPLPANADAQAAGQTQTNAQVETAAATNSGVQQNSATTGSSSTQPVIIRRTSVAPSPNGTSAGLGLNSYFPCGPDSFYYRMMMYRYGGMMPMSLYAGMGAYGGYYDPWSWAVCHTGSWIYQNNRYLWVPGSDIHYQPPVQWLKWQGRQGFVPIHPHDVAGQTPVNLQNGMIDPRLHKISTGGAIKVDGGSSVKLLNAAPRGFRDGYTISLARADSPRMEGRLIGASGARTVGAPQSRSVALSFDHDSRSFMVARPASGSNSTRTVNEPVGTFLVRSGVGGFGGPVGYHPGAGGVGMGGSDRAVSGGNAGQFHGGSVFNGGTPRGGGNYGGSFGDGSRGGGAPTNVGGYNGGGGGYSGGGGGGGAPAGGGGGSFGGGSIGGGHMGGGPSPAPSPSPSH